MPIAWPQLPHGLSDTERQAAVKAKVSEIGNGSVDIDSRLRPARMHLPMIDMGKAAGAPDTELEEYLRRGPSHPDWDDDRVTNADVIKVPGLWAEALYDISSRSTVAFFEKTRKENPAGNQAIVITNGQHAHSAARQKRPRSEIAIWVTRARLHHRQINWLDRWLKDERRRRCRRAPSRIHGRRQSLGRLQRGAVGRTRSVTVFYLTSGGRANTLKGDGRLVDAAPSAGSATRSHTIRRSR